MPSAALTLIPQTYAELWRSVEAALLTGQREIEQAKVRTYHEAGRLITGHLQLNEKRPGYGTATIAKLAREPHRVGKRGRLLNPGGWPRPNSRRNKPSVVEQKF